jgi:hypothetical protein
MSVRILAGVVVVMVVAACEKPPVHATAAGTPRSRWPAITLKHGSEPEQATRRQLERLLARHDVTPWLFTGVLEIDEQAIPHSHPVLTLSTRHLQDDLLLLATFVHEQSHWYFVAKPSETRAAIAALEAQLPDLPVAFPDGARDRESTYLHLCVNAFEYHGLRRLVGELTARQVLEFWATDHYRAIYRAVLDRYGTILAVMKAHGLEPPPRPAPAS